MSKISNDKCLDTRGCDKPGIFAKHQSRFAKVSEILPAIVARIVSKLVIQELVEMGKLCTNERLQNVPFLSMKKVILHYKMTICVELRRVPLCQITVASL